VFLNYCYHIYQNLLNFTYAFKCYHQKCKFASLSWATLYTSLLISYQSLMTMTDNQETGTWYQTVDYVEHLMQSGTSLLDSGIEQNMFSARNWHQHLAPVSWMCVTGLRQSLDHVHSTETKMAMMQKMEFTNVQNETFLRQNIGRF